MKVYHVNATTYYGDRTSLAAVLDTQESAERYITIHETEDDDLRYSIVAYNVQTVTDEEFRRFTEFDEIVAEATYARDHHLAKDDSFTAAIEERKTCGKCGASVVQLTDGTVKQYGTEVECPGKN